MLALLFRAIDALRVFDLVFVMTQGGPPTRPTCSSSMAIKTFAEGMISWFHHRSAILISLSWR
jgi:ABC-type sugar transport system permease subunit